MSKRCDTCGTQTELRTSTHPRSCSISVLQCSHPWDSGDLDSSPFTQHPHCPSPARFRMPATANRRKRQQALHSDHLPWHCPRCKEASYEKSLIACNAESSREICTEVSPGWREEDQVYFSEIKLPQRAVAGGTCGWHSRGERL